MLTIPQCQTASYERAELVGTEAVNTRTLTICGSLAAQRGTPQKLTYFDVRTRFVQSSGFDAHKLLGALGRRFTHDVTNE